MSFLLNIPLNNGSVLTCPVQIGEYAFILGANGVGKSSLMQHLYSSHNGRAYRISAHRQTWFNSNAISLSPEQKRSTEQSIMNNDTGQQSRWRDDYSAHRSSIAIYDLIDAQNVRARAIADAVDSKDINLAETLSKTLAPIKIINEILSASNIPIEIFVQQNEQILARNKYGAVYSIAELSDGERNALLLAATVLTVAPGKLLVIDEPERHLHRSIISPLLTLLFAKRNDCAFVVSTHDILLPIDNPNSKIIMVRGCTYSGQTPMSWEADFISDQSLIGDDVKKDILGARRNILFVEGNERTSLDKPLYSLLFPETSVVPKISCRDVQNAVSGIKNTADVHWVRPFGIIDNDRRVDSEIASLRDKGIYAVPVYSVESIYYHPFIQRKIAERCEALMGRPAAELCEGAKSALIFAVTPHVERLTSRAVEKRVRDELEKKWPTQREISTGSPVSIQMEVSPIIDEERRELQTAIEQRDVEKIISKYPVRETPALKSIVTQLGFQTTGQYEGAVLKLMIDNPEALDFARNLFGPLKQDLLN